jgi:hypothetical protein
MNGEWVLQIVLVLVPVLVSAVVGYFLGVRSQKKQALGEYITEIVKEKYPLLFAEMKRNSELLDSYLENPFVVFDFPKLKEMCNEGLDEFMKKHHEDLFLLVDSFYRNIRPKFTKLHNLEVESRKKIFNVWLKHLSKALSRKVVSESKRIVEDLLTVINPHNVVSDLLNEREEPIKNKIVACYLGRTAHIYRREAGKPFVIRGESETLVNFDEISKSLIKIAKPETTKFLERYKELKKQNDEEVKEKLLPQLQKYISNPV